jgi:hypothetical protein
MVVCVKTRTNLQECKTMTKMNMQERAQRMLQTIENSKRAAAVRKEAEEADNARFAAEWPERLAAAKRYAEAVKGIGGSGR